MHDKDFPIRATILRGLPAVMTELGGAGSEFLEAYGIEERITAEDEAYISFRLVERILEDAAETLGVPDFGLKMAAQQDPRILGPLAIAMENSSTIGDALTCAGRFLFVLSPALSHEVIEDPDGNAGVVAIHYASSTGASSPQAVDYGLGMVHRIVALVSGGEPYGLRSVQLPHPALASETAYRDFFKTNVLFDRPQAVLRLPRHLLSVPLSGANELLRNIAIDYLEKHFGPAEVPVAELVKEILVGQMGPEQPDLSKVSRILGLHPRRLQRLLVDEGFRFKELVDSARREQAQDLIVNTDLPFSIVADRVGLCEQASLTRAVRRWFGTSPSRLRRMSST